jgi:hypothetical protein
LDSTSEPPEFLTRAEVAERYRTDASVVKNWRRNGYGPRGVRVGKSVLYPREQVEEFDRRLIEKYGGDAA